MTDTKWPSEWLRGVLSLSVLGVLRDGPTYGYAISVALEKSGLGATKGGTLYPLLARLEKDGLVLSRWEAGDGGPGRKYFEITGDGLAHLVRRTEEWAIFTAQVERLIGSGQPATQTHRK